MSNLGYKVFQASEADFIIDPDKYEYVSSNPLSSEINTSNDNSSSDNSSSVKPNIIQNTSNNSLTNGVALYQHTNYKGYVAYIYKEGDYSLQDFKDIGIKNDDISSIRVAPGWSIELFQHHKYLGEHIEFSKDVPNLIEHNWNDSASSFIVKRSKTTAKTITPLAFSKIYKNKKDAVVSLLCKKTNGFYVGTAFFISHDGYLITAAHNIITASSDDRPSVLLATVSNINGTGETAVLSCSVIGVDGYGDVAVLKVDGVFNQTYLSWGNSRNTPIGSQICTIGNPKGQDFQSFSAGYIRDNEYIFKNLVESVAIDAQIYKGCSGSPILDIYGQVIGIVCFGISGHDGFSWGMSQHILEHVVKSIILENQNYLKGTIDFLWKPLDAYFLYRTNNVSGSLDGVFALSDSSHSEIKKDDVLIKINDQTITKNNISSILWFMKPGQEINIQYHRSSETKIRSVQFKLGTYTSEQDIITLNSSLNGEYLIHPIKI
tara:strand:+ start:971 stop:2437 length:1467 start_codon:yes stop_codon:yes gene_type:complete